MESILIYFDTPVALVGLTTLLSGWMINAFNMPKRELLGIVTLRQAATWVVGALLVVAGNFLDLGFLSGLTTFDIAGWALGIGLAANGLFKVSFVQKALSAVKAVNNRKG